MTIEITEKKDEEPKPQTEDIKETLKAADEYNKLKEQNDQLEEEQKRREALIALGGRALAGKTARTPEEKAAEEAAEHLKIFGYVPSK